MSQSASASYKTTVSSLLAGRAPKRPKLEDAEHLQTATIQFMEQQQNLGSLFIEVGNPDVYNISSSLAEQTTESSSRVPTVVAGSILASEMKRQAAKIGVSVMVLSVKMVLERLKEITARSVTNEEAKMLTSAQRVQLSFLMESSRDLMSEGALSPQLLWQEYKRDQKLPNLEVVYYLNFYSLLPLKHIIVSDESVQFWLVPQLKAMCAQMPQQEDKETQEFQRTIVKTVAEVLVGTGFDLDRYSDAAEIKISQFCCSMLDEMLFWILDSVESVTSASTGTELWVRILDASLCGVSASAEALKRFFKQSLTQIFTYKPQLPVCRAFTLQNKWTFPNINRLLTLLFRKLAACFNVEELLNHLQQVLETQEVNWKNVLCFLSTILVYYQSADRGLKALLSRLLTSSFDSYELENMLTALLLARQGSLEGPYIFPSYSDWFKTTFGGGCSYHANSKKSLLFLLKVLSDLVPFEPPQYLKVHILHPPYVPAKHRNLLMEYVTLAKTRLTDLKESVEEMGIYEDVSGAGTSAQPVCQAAQDVEKAVSLFTSTGKISTTVMEASIFRRPYFLTRFLPALLKPRVLPVKPDALMNFIEDLKKADKISPALYSSYIESCLKLQQLNSSEVSLDAHNNPYEVLLLQLQEFTQLVNGTDGDMSAQLSRISHTLSFIFPGSPGELIGQTVITLPTDSASCSELHERVLNTILRNFCQWLLKASQTNPPNKQNPWASRFVTMLLVNKQILSGVIKKLWDIFYNQESSLSAPHVLGLAAFTVHLHASVPKNLLVEVSTSTSSQQVPLGEALGQALVCNTHSKMVFCSRLCVAVFCYGICIGHSLPQQQQQEYILPSAFKKLLWLIPRLIPEARRVPLDGLTREHSEKDQINLWNTISEHSWNTTAAHLWRHDFFRQFEKLSRYQLSFSEWLKYELKVQRSQDILSDAQRQAYQQWACLEYYLNRSEDLGGCGGDMKNLCTHLLNAILNQQSHDLNLEKLKLIGAAETGTCLPDILSRLQELVYEMQVTNLSRSCGNKHDLCDLLFDLVSERCSSTMATSQNISSELTMQSTILRWNSVLLVLPAVLFIKVRSEGIKKTMDCSKLIEHINYHQRKVCSPPGLLPSPITAHFLKGLLSASVQCGNPEEELNNIWSQMNARCPLLLVSTMRWWQNLSPLLLSLWQRLQNKPLLPAQLQIFTDCRYWAFSLEKGQLLQVPSAAPLLLATSLYEIWKGCEGNRSSFRVALNLLQPEKDSRSKQVLIFLLFLYVNDYISALLCPQEKSLENLRDFCTELLNALANCSDWLLIFKPNAKSVYQSVTVVTSDECNRLMPLALCSLLIQQNDATLLKTMAKTTGFLQVAIICYLSVLKIYLKGEIRRPTTEQDTEEMEVSQILSQTKQFLLSLISQTHSAALSSTQLRQVKSQCADLDPDLAAALSMDSDPQSPEVDFL